MKRVLSETCEGCGGKGRQFLFFRCLYCNGSGKIHIPDFLSSACFDPVVLNAKSEMRSCGFTVPVTLITYKLL